ncbi:MAG: hypothetical protein EF812_06190 [Methanosarcinales archaeon]|nr:MAG: hypothetical protein EF812_06190 [Methanosarcinales archaeon]
MELSNDTKLGILTAICMLGSVIVFKNVLHITPPFIASYGSAGIFILYIILKYSIEEFNEDILYRGRSIAFYYGLTIIFATLATIILYAFF